MVHLSTGEIFLTLIICSQKGETSIEIKDRHFFHYKILLNKASF